MGARETGVVGAAWCAASVARLRCLRTPLQDCLYAQLSVVVQCAAAWFGEAVQG